MPPLLSRPITMSTMVLAESPAIDVKVAGVEFKAAAIRALELNDGGSRRRGGAGLRARPDAISSRPDPHYPLFDTLTGIGRASGVERARRLALLLLDRYDGGWNATDLPDELTALAGEIDVPEEVVRRAVAATLARPR